MILCWRVGELFGGSLCMDLACLVRVSFPLGSSSGWHWPSYVSGRLYCWVLVLSEIIVDFHWVVLVCLYDQA